MNIGDTSPLLCRTLHLVEPLSDKIWPNCAFYDTSMKFCTHLQYIITNIFGYRATSDFALECVGSHFNDGCRKAISSIERLLQRRPDVFEPKHTTSGSVISNMLHLTFYDIQIRHFLRWGPPSILASL